jgi:dimeric dUTPase (all-alpha-NTP-PPase superfamily)
MVTQMDKLETIFTMQQALNDDIVRTRHLEDITPDQWHQKLTLALLSEMAEALDGTDFKWWKNKKEKDPDYLKDEIVDMLHFLVSMALRAGMDADEMYERYLAKNKENFDRQHGRSLKPGYDPQENQK